MNALSTLPHQEKVILWGYYTDETLANGKQMKQANLKNFFNAVIEENFSTDELNQIRASDAEMETDQSTKSNHEGNTLGSSGGNE